MAKSFSTNSKAKSSLSRDPYFMFAVVTAVLFLYFLGIREYYSVSSCHRYGEKIARQKLIERVKATPDNKVLIQAAKANLYASEDYEPVFDKCLLSKGYRP